MPLFTSGGLGLVILVLVLVLVLRICMVFGLAYITDIGQSLQANVGLKMEELEPRLLGKEHS